MVSALGNTNLNNRLKRSEKFEKAKTTENWFSRLKEIRMPSGGFDLMLGTYFDRSDPSIDYLNYFLDDWREINFEDEDYILGQNNYLSWPEIEFPSSVKNIYGLNDFHGVIIIKNQFFIDSISNNYNIEMGEISLGWAGELREYDFYINGVKIGSTFGGENIGYVSKLGKRYRKDYASYPFTYTLSQKIPRKFIKLGRNEIAIRVIGSGEIKPIKITSSNSEIQLQSNWRYKVSAEV